jgi:hypothetical protein
VFSFFFMRIFEVVELLDTVMVMIGVLLQQVRNRAMNRSEEEFCIAVGIMGRGECFTGVFMINIRYGVSVIESRHHNPVILFGLSAVAALSFRLFLFHYHTFV